MSDNDSNEVQRPSNQLPLRMLMGLAVIACLLLAITRPSVAASTLVVVSVLLAIASVYMRQMRGEFIVLLLFGAPLLYFLLQYFFGGNG